MTGKDVDVGIIIKKTFKSIVHDPGYILLYVLPVAISIIFMILIQSMVSGKLFSMSQLIQNPSGYNTYNTEFLNSLKENLLLLVGIVVLYLLVEFIVSVIAMAGLIKKVEAQEKGEKLDVLAAMASGIPLFPRLFVALLLITVIVAGPILGLVALIFVSAIYNILALICVSSLLLLILIIPWFYIVIRLSLYAQACVLDNLGSLECLKRSWHITKGNVTLIFVTMLILLIIAFAISIPFTIIGLLISLLAPSVLWISSIVDQLLILVVGPLSGIVLTLLYLELAKKHTTINVKQEEPATILPDSLSRS
jgi:hypothetical protein